MDNYWCTTPLFAEEGLIQIKVLYEVKYIGFLVSDPKKEDLVSIPNSVVHPLDEQESSGDEGFEEEEKVYCCGKELEDEDWIHCDYHKCEKSWYHFSCVGITKEPIGKWYCPNCVKILEKKLDLYEKSKTIKTIYNIRKSQSFRLPYWLANQYKGLKLAIFKIPFYFSENFRDRCRENLLPKLKEKEKEKEIETEIENEQERKSQEKKNFLSLNEKCKYWYYSGTSLANASGNSKLSFDFSIIFSQRILKIMELLQFSKSNNNKPLQVLKSKPIKNEDENNNKKKNGNEKNKEKDQQVSKKSRTTLNKNRVRPIKRNFDELNMNNNSKNELMGMEEMEFNERMQTKSTNRNNIDNNNNQDINFIKKQLKDNMFTRRDNLFGNPQSWQQQQQQKRKKYYDIFSPTLEEEKFIKKLSQLEKNIYSFQKLNQKKYQYWKFGYNHN
ncbi:chromatin modification-related protein yng2 [Anaeramoeba flamelloides]|uniref:Chromatin modification-related protein yng2 n=1 Tax=Anaeramoeba flamelloides TaxID=1746091 RepID=A0ABQ8Y5R8_9EUKA|nr:chromatin modification-related protein yng2 [Anaeramoeba flamelloides]